MLPVETSRLPDFERTRAFCVKCRYEEARIRALYTTGDDKVVFREVLNLGWNTI
ncbi:hypothetical protein [Pseudanabaena sp. FACHB-2040]|uniref:hypothetical protein n=1 Tax=Pseudanabaena sp. FACHB-2040 TaxID=2692859 RepID=UPI0018EFFC54|nr:hypothetical protein [Pseudanabaena sp. FACHB-2040]